MTTLLADAQPGLAVRLDRPGGDARTTPRGCPAFRLTQRLATVTNGAHRAFGVGEEGAARVGQAHTPAGPREERLAQFALERVEAGGQGRLGHEHRLGGTTDVPPAGDLQEPLDLRQQHPLAIEVFYGDVNWNALRMTPVTWNS